MKKKKWVWIVGVLLILIGITEIHSQFEKRAADKKEAEIAANADNILKGYVAVPDPYFKQKDEVEKIYKNKGLKVDFVVRNFDEKADTNKKKIYVGTCDQLAEDNGAKYFDIDKVGLEKAGYYAKKGTTVLVGYSDHDYDPSSKQKRKSSETTESKKESDSTDLKIQLEKKELISDSNGKVIIKGKTKPDARVSVGMGIVGDSTTADKDGTFELTHELTNAKPEELVINASLDDLSTSETINVRPSEEAKKQEENNNDITKLSKEPTTEQQAILDNLAKQQFEELYPYKGSKMHSILGNIQSWTQNNGSWYKKVEATIVNAYGAERSTTIEIHITPQSPNSGIVEIIEY